MKNTVTNIRAEFEKQLRDALIKNGKINLIADNGKSIDMILLAEPKGLYCADEADDYEPIEVHAILQCTETGKIFVSNIERGITELNFDFVGNKEELYKHIIQEKERLSIEASKLKPIPR